MGIFQMLSRDFPQKIANFDSIVGTPETEWAFKQAARAAFFSSCIGRNPDGTDWLGRQDSNLGMAESKSNHFANYINAHSEKIAKFDPLSTNRLAADSECGEPSSLSATPQNRNGTGGGGLPYWGATNGTPLAFAMTKHLTCYFCFSIPGIRKRNSNGVGFELGLVRLHHIQPFSSRARTGMSRPRGAQQCPLLRSLLGVKRTCLIAAQMSAFDPKRTFAFPVLRPRRELSPTPSADNAVSKTRKFVA
jgi:hypothetical protein